jgi:peptidyl-prolyl cis-trans isomerase A (cyclophilin A)
LLLVSSALFPGLALAQEAAQSQQAASAPAAIVKVVLHTTLGDIHIALETERAPITANNFLRYVDRKRFDGIGFYRAVKIGDEGQYGLVQAGLMGNPKLVFKPIAHEAPAATGLSHVDGAISMAHSVPGTATSDFFIVVGDLIALDGKGTPEEPGYAVFGHVVEGMDVVRAIRDQPRDPNAGETAMKGQMLASPIKVLSARRAD